MGYELILVLIVSFLVLLLMFYLFFFKFDLFGINKEICLGCGKGKRHKSVTRIAFEGKRYGFCDKCYRIIKTVSICHPAVIKYFEEFNDIEIEQSKIITQDVKVTTKNKKKKRNIDDIDKVLPIDEKGVDDDGNEETIKQ